MLFWTHSLTHSLTHSPVLQLLEIFYQLLIVVRLILEQICQGHDSGLQSNGREGFYKGLPGEEGGML